MRGLRAALAVYAAAWLAWAADARPWEDLRALAHSRRHVGGRYSLLLGEWPEQARRLYSLPRCVKPGLAVERPGARFTTLALKGSECGYRSNGDDRAEPAGVVLGDSYTAAEDVSDEQTWVARLSALSGRRLLNLGVGGQGLEGHLARWNALPSPRPRLAVVQLCGNDPREDEWVALARAGRAPVPPSYANRHPLLSYLIGLFLSRVRGLEPRSESQRRVFRENLKRLDAEIRRAGSTPWYLDVDGHLAWEVRQALGPDAPVDSFSARKSEKLFLDKHWSARGHASAARFALERLRARGLLDPRARPME